jgi:hypothetical protein
MKDGTLISGVEDQKKRVVFVGERRGQTKAKVRFKAASYRTTNFSIVGLRKSSSIVLLG